MPYFDYADDYIDFLKSTLIPDLRESGKRRLADDFEEAIYWITKRTGQMVGQRQAKHRVSLSKPKRKLSAWQKFVKANSKKPKFRYKSGAKKGKLNLKAMGVAYRKKKR